jgi:hypothetical protein
MYREKCIFESYPIMFELVGIEKIHLIINHIVSSLSFYLTPFRHTCLQSDLIKRHKRLDEISCA